MAAKPLDFIIGQPTTETMNKMVEQMAPMVAPVKTVAWGGCHGSLALVLNKVDYSSITKARVTSTKPVMKPRWHIPVFVPICWGAGIQDRIPVQAGMRRNLAATSMMFRLFYGPEPYFRSGPDKFYTCFTYYVCKLRT